MTAGFPPLPAVIFFMGRENFTLVLFAITRIKKTRALVTAVRVRSID